MPVKRGDVVLVPVPDTSGSGGEGAAGINRFI
jgi:predicted RNA-binding protein with TRAM domain